MELMTPATGTLFWTTVTFVALLIILRKIAWGPILQSLEERENKISESLEEAENIKQMSADLIKQQGEIILEARQIAKETVNKAENSAEKIKDDIVAKAKDEADLMVEKAQRNIELSKDKALLEIQTLAVDLSMSATAKILGQSLDEQAHKQIIKDSLNKIGKES
jgi:F-type H+-transporting ATPase subunit b